MHTFGTCRSCNSYTVDRPMSGTDRNHLFHWTNRWDGMRLDDRACLQQWLQQAMVGVDLASAKADHEHSRFQIEVKADQTSLHYLLVLG